MYGFMEFVWHVYTVKVFFTRNGKAHMQDVCEGATCIQQGTFVWHVLYVQEIEQRHRAELVPLTLLSPFYNLT